MEISADTLRNEIKKAMLEQGFLINPHLRPIALDKGTIREIHKRKRLALIKQHKIFLKRNLDKVKQLSISGGDLDPNKIKLELIEVKPKTLYSDIFLWWNLIWWSLPFDRPIGRQMRFILWDRYHNAPFGLIGLQSPPLRSWVRDDFIGLNSKQKGYSYWLNQSMYAQRVGALPPYNELLGGKMVGLSLTANEIRDCYNNKYLNRATLLDNRVLPSLLLFITTTSAYGKSSVYERIKYKGEAVSRFIGYTAGTGTFHVPDDLYEKILLFLYEEGIDVKRGYGTGPSRKLELITIALKKLGIGNYTEHNIKRGHYIFENVKNLKEVIHKKAPPIWYDRPFECLAKFWKERWCIPRSERSPKWREFKNQTFFDDIQGLLDTY